MPELPEVETVVRGLRAPLMGKTFASVWFDWPRSIKKITPEDFQARLPGQTIQSIDRRAKYILMTLDAGTLIIHLKMTGRLYVVDTNAQNDSDRWVHFRFGLTNGRELRFSDARKFGRVYLVDDPASVTGKLGPEPLADDFTPAAFLARLAHRSGMIKPLLMNQAFIAGIGNIYADESLHRSKIHPRRQANSLSEDEQLQLYNNIRLVLTQGIQQEGASINWYRTPDGRRGSSQNHFRVYGQTGHPCPECATPVERIVVGGRSTHICPTCQPSPEI